MMSKIQILKAIHNEWTVSIWCTDAVYDVKDTNFESNSQPRLFYHISIHCCLWCQRYKFWKQFTTFFRNLIYWFLLFMMSKIQILKAIHNSITFCKFPTRAVYDVKDTNFESNSQQFVIKFIFTVGCLWCQRYKFWKQFTTKSTCRICYLQLFMMSKIQILKAIHNR